MALNLTVGGDSGDINFAQDTATVTQDKSINTYNTSYPEINKAIQEENINDADKDLLSRSVEQLEEELKNKPNTTTIQNILKTVKRLSPTILKIVLATFANPYAGAGIVLKNLLDTEE